MPLYPIIQHTRFRRLAIVCLLVCLRLAATAQRVDTLVLIKQFMQAGATSRQLPLYLEMELHHSTNFMMGEEDTASAAGSFYLLPHASYVRMGEAEQIINDSMALVVSNKMQHMMLYTDAQAVLAQMKAVAGPALQDSSVEQVAARYTIQLQQGANGRVIYLVTDKRPLYSTSLPRESLELQYDAGGKRPLEMITIKRTLVPLSVEDYTALQGNAGMAANLVNKEDKEYYLVREQVTRFVYKSISHDAAMMPPVMITDRISRSGEGPFQPVNAYKHFTLTVN